MTHLFNESECKAKDLINGFFASLRSSQNDIIIRFIFSLFIINSSLLFTGCFILRPVAGASFDKEQISKARESKSLEIQFQSAQRLEKRLSAGAIDNADFSFYFNQEMINKAASQLDGSAGWLDSLNSYTIRSIRVVLNNGSAIATINLGVYNHHYDVNVDLLLDCLLSFKVENGKLYAQFEPFTIVPNVTASGMLSTLSGIIQDLVELKLTEMSNTFPPIEMPIDFSNQFPMPPNTVNIRNFINMDVAIPGQTIEYALQLKEVLILKNTMLVAMNLTIVRMEK